MNIQGVEGSERLKKMLARFCVHEKLIERRYFECPDVYSSRGPQIYKIDKSSPGGVRIEERNQFFSERATEIIEKMYESRPIPDHLIHVTCTGYVSPSAPQLYFSRQKEALSITHAYHMGCYASLPAVRIAQSFAALEQNVDVVHTEMCSLHLDPSVHSPEQMVVQSLFADGHIKYTLSPKKEGRRFEVICIKEKIIPESHLDMTWLPSSNNMKMTLSKDVPEKIKGELPQFLRELGHEINLSLDELLHQSMFAIHPGGPKIIDAVEDQLELSGEQTSFSREVLKTRGNMSSATLPHIWEKIMDSEYQGRVVSLAFGPGLTIFGSVFEARA